MSGQKDILVLITTDYPFRAVSESFLDDEINYLAECFDRVVIVPRSYESQEEEVSRQLPDNVEIDKSILLKNDVKGIIRYFVELSFFVIQNLGNDRYRQIIFCKDTYLNNEKIKYLAGAVIVKNWIENFIEENTENIDNTVFYSYWPNAAAMGIGLQDKQKINVISRAHRRFLYEEHAPQMSIPFRYETLSTPDIIVPISEDGKRYIKENYGYVKDVRVSRLGVKPVGYMNRPSTDGAFRITSLSYVTEIKRIDLIIEGIKKAADNNPDLEIQWRHIGYGPLFSQMKELAKREQPPNCKMQMLGFLTDEEIESFYQYEPTDLFMNLSSSEGIPVSIMEAQRCGIPVMATDVGGVSEIINEQVGVLLPSDPTIEEIADAIQDFIKYPSKAQTKRLASYENWKKRYCDKINYRHFVGIVKQLMESNR